MQENKCTIFEHLFTTNTPYHITVKDALMRIKNGRSKQRVEELRATIDKDRQDAIKKQLPSVCFSGVFGKRDETALTQHSGFLVLDFDNLNDVSETAAAISEKDFIYALWLSPRGNGLKALVKIADGSKHREHFAAIRETFPEIDKSGSDPARVCFESYDPNLQIYEDAKVFTKVLTITKEKIAEVEVNETEIFTRLLTWISNRGGAFVSGERNSFIYKLACACSRFGISDMSAESLMSMQFPISNDFTVKELNRTIASAYKRTKSEFGSCVFEKDILVDRKTRKEVEIKHDIYDLNEPALDVVYGEYVKKDALNIYYNGYGSVNGLGIEELDNLFKEKKGEITGLSGIGNYGKSAYHKWRILMRMLLFDEKFATFAPEDNPAYEFYHDFAEMICGDDCTPKNPYRPNVETYDKAYDFVSKHLFYIYPKELTPSPEYVKERFLELIIKERIDGVYIDPFNQMAHDYSKSGGRSDKYLETVLGDFSRFAQANNIYFTIIMHPKQIGKTADKNYECPDIFDLNDGAMWNNKLDNILIYHRPFMQTDPQNPICELHAKKIRRGKVVGKKGIITFEYSHRKRRFEFNGVDPMSIAIRNHSTLRI